MIDLNTFLNKYYEQSTFDGKFISVNLEEEDREFLISKGISYDTDFEKINIINPFVNNLYIYFNASDFAARYNLLEDFDNCTILILGNASTYSLKGPFEKTIRVAPILNYQAYKLIIDLFSKSADFISLHNTTDNEFVLISTEKGVNYLKYDLINEQALELNDLPELHIRLRTAFSRAEFQAFFKSIVLETMPKHNEQVRFRYLITSLSVLIDLAERDFQIYIRKFAFEQVKTKFKEERNKYFESVEKNIDSINKQVLALPLTFSATIFASYQVKNNPIVLLFVLIAYILYTKIALKVLNISRENVNYVFNDVQSESSKINELYDRLYAEFKPDFDKIHHKIRQIRDLIGILRFTLCFLLIIFIVFVFWYICKPSVEIKPFDSILASLIF